VLLQPHQQRNGDDERRMLTFELFVESEMEWRRTVRRFHAKIAEQTKKIQDVRNRTKGNLSTRIAKHTLRTARKSYQSHGYALQRVESEEESIV
jgi:hypothetical protein